MNSLDRDWMVFGGIIAFGAFNFIAVLWPEYMQSTEIELFQRWSVIILGALLGAAISLGKNRRRLGKFIVVGALGSWLAMGVISSVIAYYDDWIHPFDLSYPAAMILSYTLNGTVEGAILGYLMNGWRGLLFLALLGALSMGGGITLAMLSNMTASLEVQILFENLGKGVFLIQPVVSSLIWGCGWLYCPQFFLQESVSDDD